MRDRDVRALVIARLDAPGTITIVPNPKARNSPTRSSARAPKPRILSRCWRRRRHSSCLPATRKIRRARQSSSTAMRPEFAAIRDVQTLDVRFRQHHRTARDRGRLGRRAARPRTLFAIGRRARRTVRTNPARQSPALRRLPHAHARRVRPVADQRKSSARVRDNRKLDWPASIARNRSKTQSKFSQL